MNEPARTTLENWGLLPLRIVVGLVFLMHGWQKLFDLGLGGTTDLLGKLEIPLASFFAVVIQRVGAAWWCGHTLGSLCTLGWRVARH